MKKHNGINNITLPVFKDLKKEIADSIKTDKEILKQVKVVPIEGSNDVDAYFPKGVIPLAITDDDSYDGILYCDYENERFVDEFGDSIDDIQITMSEDVVVMTYSNDFSLEHFNSVIYIYGEKFNVVGWGLNGYKILKPTKLYSHWIEGYADFGGVTYEIYFGFKDNNPSKILTSDDFLRSVYENPSFISFIGDMSNQSSSYTIISLFALDEDYYGVLCRNDMGVISSMAGEYGDIRISDDTVTPL